MTTELGTVRGRSTGAVLLAAGDLLVGAHRPAGAILQVLVFRQGTEWLATATLFDGALGPGSAAPASGEAPGAEMPR